MKLDYQVISSEPLLIKFFYQEGEKYGEFYLRQTVREAKDANNPTDKIGVRGTMMLEMKDPDYAIDLLQALAKTLGLNLTKPLLEA